MKEKKNQEIPPSKWEEKESKGKSKGGPTMDIGQEQYICVCGMYNTRNRASSDNLELVF